LNRESADFFSHWEQVGYDRSFFKALTYTQWEAALAIYLKKHFFPLAPTKPIKDGHPEDWPRFQPTATDQISQKKHIAWLGNVTVARHLCEFGATKGKDAFEDALDEIHGFLHHVGGNWRIAAEQLKSMGHAQNRFGKGAVGQLTTKLTRTYTKELKAEQFLSAAAAQIWGYQFLDVLRPRGGPKVDQQKYVIDRLAEHPDPMMLLCLACLAQLRLKAKGKLFAVLKMGRWIAKALKATDVARSTLEARMRDVLCECADDRMATLPRPTIQATYEDSLSVRNAVTREARILWGRSAQILDLGSEKQGPLYKTADAVEEAI
jgi:hypothetical protein